MSNQKSFVVSLLIAIAALSALAFAMCKAELFLTQVTLKVMLGVIPSFALLSFLLYKNILRSTAKSPKRFVAAFIGAVSIKLFACAIFLAIYMYNKGEGKVIVALGTMAIYIVFNVLLMRFLMAAVRNK